MNLIVYIRDRIVSLFRNTAIAITYAVIDIRDLKTRYVNYTSTINLPLDENNKEIFGMPDDIKSGSSIPYSEMDARCVVSGKEYFKGKFEISGTDKTINGSIYEQAIEIFDLIEGKKLYELNHLTPTAWNAADIDGFRFSTSNVLAPVINWGDFDTGAPSINPTLYLPSYSYMELVIAILESTGYTVSGAVLTDADFTSIIMPFALDDFNYVEAYQTERTFSAENTTPQVLLSDASEKIVIDSIISQGLQEWYETANSRFQIPNFSSSGDIGSVDLYVNIEFNIEMGYIPTAAEERIQIIKNGSTVVATRSVFPANDLPADYMLSFNVKDYAFQDGDYYEVFFTSFNEIPDVVTINRVNFYGNVTRKPFRNLLFHSYLLPDIEQKEILLDFFVRAGAFTKSDPYALTLQVKTIKEVIRDKASAKDWTNKRVKGVDKIAYKYDDYAQQNIFKYDETDDVPEDLGNGILPVNNQTLEETDDYYTSIFGNTLTEQPGSVSVNMAYIPVYDNTSADIYDFKNSPGLRLLMMRLKATGEPDIEFNGVARTNYRVGYFVDDAQVRDMKMQYFIDQWYSDLIISFDKVKLVSRSYILSKEDIADGLMIIYDSGNYFLVNKIPKFIAGKVTSGIEILRVF